MISEGTLPEATPGATYADLYPIPDYYGPYKITPNPSLLRPWNGLMDDLGIRPTMGKLVKPYGTFTFKRSELALEMEKLHAILNPNRDGVPSGLFVLDHMIEVMEREGLDVLETPTEHLLEG